MTDSQSTTGLVALSTHDVALPKHLRVQLSKGNLLTEHNTYGYDGERFFGTAFIQGKRLQFSTAMPLSTMLKVSKIDRAKAGAGVAEVITHANRPRVPGHAKALRDYFLNTACQNEKFILPAFAFNFGDEITTPEEAPDAVLVIYAEAGEESTNGWPALFQLPNAIKLDTTDGAHRSGEITNILNDRSVSEAERDYLYRNACDVKIIFESNRIDAHQDFADCAKAKPITGSLISTFDVRDVRNKRAVDLVGSLPFLRHYVDATAANVNLSARSLKAWSMSAVRGFVGHVQDHYPPDMGSTEPEVEKKLIHALIGAEDFFVALIAHLPQLRSLERARLEIEDRRANPTNKPLVHTETAATFRTKRGGDIALRGVGMSLFARAFIYAKANGLSFADVAKRLALVDWHLLDCEKADLPDPSTDLGRQTYADEVRAHVNPMWASLLVIGENRYKIGSSNSEASQAWDRIKARFLDSASTMQVAAE